MASFKKSYLEELARMQDRFNSLFEQALVASDYEELEGGLPGTWAPVVDLIEGEDAYLLTAELPGVAFEDIHVQLRERRLELSGRRQPLGGNRNFLRMERSYGPFRRAFDLGSAVNAEAIQAEFEQGILRVRLPKAAARSARRTRREGGG